MSILRELENRFRRALADLAADPRELLDLLRRCQDPRFGDYQANLAMPLGKRLGRPPREVAAEIIGRLKVEDFCLRPEVAGPGFINLKIRDDWIAERLTSAVRDDRLRPPARSAALNGPHHGPRRRRLDPARLAGDPGPPIPLGHSSRGPRRRRLPGDA